MASEDLSPLHQTAVQLHELYESLVEGGFTRTEAIRIIGTMLAASAGQSDDG